MITGLFRHRRSPLRQQHLRRQPKRILRTHGDQDLLGPREDAPPRQRVPGDKLDQLRIIAVIVIRRQRLKILLTQRPQGTVPPIGMIEHRRIGLPVNERIAIA